MDEKTCARILYSETHDWSADSANLSGLDLARDEFAKAIWQSDGRGFSPPGQPTVADMAQPAALAAWQACGAAAARVSPADRATAPSPTALFISSADPAADNAMRYPWLMSATPARRAGPFQSGGFGKYVWVYSGRDVNLAGRFPRDTDPVVGVAVSGPPAGLLERLGSRPRALAFGGVIALFVVAFSGVGWVAYRAGAGRVPHDLTGEWVVAAISIGALIVLSGCLAGRGVMGAMVDSRNRLSLSLAQVAGWSILCVACRLFRGRRNEALAQEWTTLGSLWRACRETVVSPEWEQIDKIFDERSEWGSDAEDWRQFNEAEQRVGSHLTQAQLIVEFHTLLGIARERSLPSLALHAANEPLFTSDPEKLEAQRATYLALLHALQSAFSDARFGRALRVEVSWRLFWLGLIALGVTLLIPIAVSGSQYWLLGQPEVDLALAAGFGLLGAYFSRATAFQSKLAALGFDEVMNSYTDGTLLVRMLYGMIGAIVFYFLMESGLVKSELLPDLSKALSQNGGTEIAKLVIASFLAGFSERLVPDALGTIKSPRAAGGPSGGS